MSVKEARLLLKMAFDAKDESDRKGLIALADKLLADIESEQVENKNDLVFPVNIFRKYRGKTYNGQLHQGWRVTMEGTAFNSPSQAAVFISGYPENGWRAWKYLDEKTNSEYPIDRIRRMVKK